MRHRTRFQSNGGTSVPPFPHAGSARHPRTAGKPDAQVIIAAICVNPSATDRKIEPPARRADGAARPIAARTAGTRLDPPVRKIVSMAAGRRPAAAMQSRRRLVQPIYPRFDGAIEIDRVAVTARPASRKVRGTAAYSSALSAILRVLHGKRQAMAEPVAHHASEDVPLSQGRRPARPARRARARSCRCRRS